jgi:hypothetical protein
MSCDHEYDGILTSVHLNDLKAVGVISVVISVVVVLVGVVVVYHKYCRID